MRAGGACIGEGWAGPRGKEGVLRAGEGGVVEGWAEARGRGNLRLLAVWVGVGKGWVGEAQVKTMEAGSGSRAGRWRSPGTMAGSGSRAGLRRGRDSLAVMVVRAGQRRGQGSGAGLWRGQGSGVGQRRGQGLRGAALMVMARG